MGRAYDAIVIGAGVMGASIAFHLARAGVRNTVVLDRGGVCSGNTGKSGALVRMHYTNEPEARMAFASLPYFQNWADVVGGECGFKNVGALVLVSEPNSDKLDRNIEMLRGIGVDTRRLDADELREIQPTITLEDGAAAAFEPRSGYADPVATTHAFMNAACDSGVTFREGVSVGSIRSSGGRVLGVATSDGDFEAPLVFCAANVWSPALLGSVEAGLDLWAQRSQISFFARPPELQERARVILDIAGGAYCRPQSDDLYLIGSSRQALQRVDPDNYNEENDPDFPARALEHVSRRLPPLAGAAYVRGHAGVYDMSPDTRAILDRVPGVEGLFVAAGFSGTGFKISPMVGATITELALEGRSRSVDLRPFRWSRFAENDPIGSSTEYDLPSNWGHKF